MPLLMMILSVVVPVPLPQPFLTYIYKGRVGLGVRVLVPLGRRHVVGLVVAIQERELIDSEKLKEVIELIDVVPLVDRSTIDMIAFAASYYLSSMSEIARLMLPAPLLTQTYAPSVRLFKNRRKKAIPVYEPVDVEPIWAASDVALVHHSFDYPVAKAIVANHTVGATLVIVPSRFDVDRLVEQIGRYAPTVAYHKQLSTTRRADIFVDLSTIARSVVVVGTSAALGLSIVGLERIFVVQEESNYYKSQRDPRFSARDLAVYLAKHRAIQLFLMSELPSVESFYNAHAQASWGYVDLCEPPVEPRSIRLEHGSDFMSKYLRARIADELSASRRVVIMQNRRGFGTPTCAVCGYVPMCPNCNCSLTLHLWKGAIECHYCGHTQTYSDKCPKCAGTMSDTRGRGTERVVEQLRELYPHARIERLDSDASADFTDIVDRFARSASDIVVGTRVVVDALSYDGVGLVAVVNADNLLSAPDFRASEDAFRLMYKLARRASKADAEVVLQTSNYSNPLFSRAMTGHALAFYRSEAADRSATRYPPFTRLIQIDMRSSDLALLVARGQVLETSLREVFGSGLSPLFQPSVERQQGLHVVGLLLRVDRKASSVEAKRRLMAIVEPFRKANAKHIVMELIVDPN